MPHVISRRSLLAASVFAASVLGTSGASGKSERQSAAQSKLAALEAGVKGRLGVAALDVTTGRRIDYRTGERFAMCSTFKLLLVASVLQAADRHQDDLGRRIVFSERDFLSHSPITSLHKGLPGMTIKDLCEAAIAYSDNTAANGLLANFGGPSALTAWLRAMGDPVTRLDRTEPSLNEAIPGDPRDTTTPSSMLDDARKIVLGDVLAPPSRTMLTGWLIADTTGAKRLRAGLPQGWRAGDKTGTSGNGCFNDVAVIWPPKGGPLIVSAFLAESKADDADSEAVLEEIGKLVAAMA
ncbi:MAG: class A beta-lactamase [Rhizomicrobium sp.]|jgi:beta-lactamase class A